MQTWPKNHKWMVGRLKPKVCPWFAHLTPRAVHEGLWGIMFVGLFCTIQPEVHRQLCPGQNVSVGGN